MSCKPTNINTTGQQFESFNSEIHPLIVDTLSSDLPLPPIAGRNESNTEHEHALTHLQVSFFILYVRQLGWHAMFAPEALTSPRITIFILKVRQLETLLLTLTLNSDTSIK